LGCLFDIAITLYKDKFKIKQILNNNFFKKKSKTSSFIIHMNVEEYELTSQRVIVQVIGFFIFFWT
jgi:hypothetical protein